MKKEIKYAVLGGLVTAVAFAGVTAFLTRNDEKTTDLGAAAYACYRLDDSTGAKNEDDKSGISTTKYYEFGRLESITVEEDVDVKYYINVYDEDKKFVQVDEYTADLTDEELAAYESIGAAYFKIEIVDPNDDDDEISLLEKIGLSGKVTVTLNDGAAETEETKK